MGKLVVGTFVTADGVMQAPGGPDEDREGGFEHGGWLVPHFDDTLGRFMDELLVGRADALLLGRKTYEIFAGYWPTAGPRRSDGEQAEQRSEVRRLANPRQRRLEQLEPARRRRRRGRRWAQSAHRRRDPHVTGSGDLIQTLLKNDLVDYLC